MTDKENTTFGISFAQEVGNRRFEVIKVLVEPDDEVRQDQPEKTPSNSLLTLNDFRKWQLMDCDSLHENDYSIETESGRVKAVVECVFGGYYPLAPATKL